MYCNLLLKKINKLQKKKELTFFAKARATVVLQRKMKMILGGKLIIFSSSYYSDWHLVSPKIKACI